MFLDRTAAPPLVSTLPWIHNRSANHYALHDPAHSRSYHRRRKLYSTILLHLSHVGFFLHSVCTLWINQHIRQMLQRFIHHWFSRTNEPYVSSTHAHDELYDAAHLRSHHGHHVVRTLNVLH